MNRERPLALVVDDDAGLRSVLERQPDVAIVDLQMPDVGGLEVLGAMRAAAPDSRIDAWA